MSRTRLLKPSFFKNENLADLPMAARLLFAGLWTLADRQGRLEDRPRRIKAELLPYDSVNCDSLLTELYNAGFIVRYETEGFCVIQVVSFDKHQSPHHAEKDSQLPEIPTDASKHVITRNNELNRPLTLNPLTLTLNRESTPAELNFDAWEKYKAHRRDIRAKPLTPKGEQAAIKKWCKSSHQAQALAVENSIENGHIGCWPDKCERGPAKPNDPYYDEIREFVANADD